MVYYIGLDQSLASSGWAIAQVSDTGEVHFIDNGVFFTSPRDMTMRRLSQIYQFVHEKVIEFKPEFLFTEMVYNHALLTKVETVIHLIAEQNKIRFCIIPSAKDTAISWRNVLGIGSEGKKKNKVLAQAYLKEKFGLDIKTSHEAEAICITLTGLVNLKVINKDLDKVTFNLSSANDHSNKKKAA